MICKLISQYEEQIKFAVLFLGRSGMCWAEWQKARHFLPLTDIDKLFNCGIDQQSENMFIRV